MFFLWPRALASFWSQAGGWGWWGVFYPILTSEDYSLGLHKWQHTWYPDNTRGGNRDLGLQTEGSIQLSSVCRPNYCKWFEILESRFYLAREYGEWGDQKMLIWWWGNSIQKWKKRIGESWGKDLMSIFSKSRLRVKAKKMMVQDKKFLVNLLGFQKFLSTTKDRIGGILVPLKSWFLLAHLFPSVNTIIFITVGHYNNNLQQS